MPSKVNERAASQPMPPAMMAILRGVPGNAEVVSPEEAAEIAAERIFAAARTAREAARASLSA